MLATIVAGYGLFHVAWPKAYDPKGGEALSLTLLFDIGVRFLVVFLGVSVGKLMDQKDSSSNADKLKAAFRWASITSIVFGYYFNSL